MAVPKIIHQIMHNFKCDYPPEQNISVIIPDKWKISPIEWKKHHPNWEHKIWNDYESRELIKNNYNWFLETYDNYKYPIQRVDAVRYFILHNQGGLYTDLDTYPVCNLEKYFNYNLEAYFVNGEFCLNNAFLVSTKGANIWNGVFKSLQSKCKASFPMSLSKHLTVMTTTGPLFLDNIVKKYECDTLGYLPRQFSVHETDKYKPCTTLIECLPGTSWCSIDTRILTWINHNREVSIVILTLIVVLILGVLIYVIIYFKNKYKKCKTNK